MTKTERIAALEAKVAALEARVVATEAAAFRRLVQPINNPWWPSYPYWSVTTNPLVGTIAIGSTTGTYTQASDNVTYTNGTNMVSQ